MNPLLSLLPCPLLMLLAALTVKRHSTLTRLSAVLGWAQLGTVVRLCGGVLMGQPAWAAQGFRIDSTAAFFIALTSLVVAASLTHAVVFFDHELESLQVESESSVSQFYFFMSLFMVTMYFVLAADDLGYLWISMELTTLVSAPLVYYHRSRSSLEAAWKYLIICSVAIAFAFFGTALVFSASQKVAALPEGSLSLTVLKVHAASLPVGLMRLGFVFILLGYGTKAGLFPLHSWLPEAHSEAPAPASAVLSGAMLNCALVPLWRLSGVMEAAGDGGFIRSTLFPMGVVTVLAASLFLIRQTHLKRLWAYSSMENVGLMAVAVSLGSGAGFFLQAANHSLVKVALFLLSGNLLQRHETKGTKSLRGLLSTEPGQGMALLVAGLAVAGTPPFGSFLAEWQILSTSWAGGYGAAVAILVAALAVAFIAICLQVATLLFGEPPESRLEAGPGEVIPSTFRLVAVPALLLAVSLFLGLALSPGIFAMMEAMPR